MRKANVPGQKSVMDRLYGKFAPEPKPDNSGLSTDQIRQAEADRGKQIGDRDGITARAYIENRPGNVSHQPKYNSDDREMIIREAGKALLDSLHDRIGKGGILIESVDNGFKVQASRADKTSTTSQIIKRARAVFRVEFQTAMPNVKRVAYASVEYDAEKDTGNQFKLAEYMAAADDVNVKIAMKASEITDFINEGSKRFAGSDELKRMASRQDNLGENPYDNGRKLVIRDWSNPEITAYKKVAVRNVENSVGILKANGIDIQKRVFDASHGMTDVTGPVYEICAMSSQYQKIDAMLRDAGEFTLPSREVKNDEASNKARGEVFKNEEQNDDPSKFPGRSSEKEKPSYKNATPEKWAKDSEGKAFEQNENDDPNKWAGRSSEKNEGDVKGKLPNAKPKSDEKPNKEGSNPNMPGPGTSDERKDWPNRSLEAGSSLGVGEMMKYDRYQHQRQAQMSATPLGSYQMDTPLGGDAQVAPMGGGADDIGGMIDSPDVGVVQDEGGNVVLVVPKDKLVDLAGTVGVGGDKAPPVATPPAPPGGMTTPDDKGLPGAQAKKKGSNLNGQTVPMPLGNAVVQKTPDSPERELTSMDGMSHSKSANEGNTPKIVPTDEFKKNPPKARAMLRLRFNQASAAFAAAQRLAVKAAEASNNGAILSRQQFADATRVAQFMVGKDQREGIKNPYTVTMAHLPKNDPLGTFMKNAMQKVAVPGGSGGAPNAKAPKSKGREDSMDGLDHGKSDAGDNLTGYRSSDEPEAKKNEIGGINKNPEDPNVSKDDDEMDGLSHGKSSGGEAKVTPSAEYKGSNPVKPMKSKGKLGKKFADFREELLEHLSGSGPIKNPHRVFASIKSNVTADYDAARAAVMEKFAKFEISDTDVTSMLGELDAMRDKRLAVVDEARTAVFRKAKRARKTEAKDGKPDPHFKMPDEKNKYNHQEDQWWDRALEKQSVPSGGVEDMGLKEDEDKAMDSDLYDKSTNFVGRTDEKSGGIEHKNLHKLRDDEDKAFGHQDDYDDPNDWVGRAADKGWTAPTSNDYMLKTERKKEIEKRIASAIEKKTGEYTQPEFNERIAQKMFDIGGLVVKKEGSAVSVLETGKNDRRQYCYGTRRIAVMQEVVDLYSRGLSPLDITYRFARTEPDMLINVNDIVDGWRTAKALVKKAGAQKPTEDASKKKSIEASIKSKLSKKDAATAISDSELKKVLELGGLDENGERTDHNSLTSNHSGRFYFGCCDPDKIRDVINCHKKGMTTAEISYYTGGKYKDAVWEYDVQEIVAAYKSKGKKKGSAASAAEAAAAAANAGGADKSHGKTLKDESKSAEERKKWREGEDTSDYFEDVKKREAAGKEDYNKRSYDEDRKDDIASDMPEQKMWQKGETSEADPKKGRSDQPGDLDKDQRPQPTISSQEKENQKETKGYDWKKESAANPFAVCNESVGTEKTDKRERCIKDVKKKNKEEGASEIPETPKKDKKEAQVNEDVLPLAHRDDGVRQQFNMVTKHMQPGNNVTYAGNDTVYDNTGRFPKADPKSPYTVAHVVEQVLIGLGNRSWDNAQDALDGIAAGDRFGRLSQGQLSLITTALSAHGFKLKEPKAREYNPPTALKKK